MRRAIRVIRFVAIVGLVLSAPLVPLGLGGAALGIGLWMTILGIAGVGVGGALAVLATRVRSDPVEIRGSRRALLVAGVAVAVSEVLLSVNVGGDSSFFVRLSVAFAVGFLVIAVTTHHRGDSLLAGLLAVPLLALGGLLLWGGASQAEFDARKAPRAALVPVDLFDVRDAVATAAPDGWHAAALKARVTDRGPLLMTLRLVLTGGSDLRGDTDPIATALREFLPQRAAAQDRVQVGGLGSRYRSETRTNGCW